MGLLAGKKGVILNIANDRSIAWHIARNAVQQGANCAFGYLPLEKMERRVRMAMQEGGFGQMPLFPCDVSKDEDIAAFFESVQQELGTIDFVVHSLAFANKNYLQIGQFTETPRDVFKQALDISAYSLIALSRAAAPLMPNGGSIICLSYLGAEKVIPGYNVMGVAKSALESSARYLAYELGDKKHPRQHHLGRPGAHPLGHGRRRHRLCLRARREEEPAAPQHRRRRSRQDRRLPALRPLQRRHRRNHLRRQRLQRSGPVTSSGLASSGPWSKLPLLAGVITGV